MDQGVCLELLTHNPSRATTNPSLRHQNCQGVDVSNMPNYSNLDGKLVRNRSPSRRFKNKAWRRTLPQNPILGPLGVLMPLLGCSCSSL